MVVKKVFLFVKPFLANLQSTRSKKYSYVLNVLNTFLQKYQNMQNFTLISNPRKNNWQKELPEKVICQKPFQVSSIEEAKLQFCTLFCLQLF
jgi:hypothetical protein